MPFRPLAGAGAVTKVDTPSVVEKIGGGLVTGLRKDPFLRPIVEGIANMGDVNTEDLDALERRLEGQAPARVAELVGEWGPTFLFAGGAFTAGKAAAILASRAAGQRILAKQGRDAVIAMASRKGLQGQLGRMTIGALDEVGEGALRVQGVTGLERAGQIAAGNLGVSGFVFAQEKARGKEDDEALRNAALALALGMGADAGLTLLGKAIAPRARSMFLNKVEEGFDQPGPLGVSPRKVLEDASVTIGTGKSARKVKLGVRIDELNRDLQDLLGVGAQSKHLDMFAHQGGGPAKLLRGVGPDKAERAREAGIRVLPKEQRAVALQKFAEKQLLESERRGIGRVLNEPGALPYISGGAYKAGGWRAQLARVSMRLWSSPEAFFGAGATNNRIFTQLQRRVDMADAVDRQLEVVVERLAERARQGLGISQNRFRKGVSDQFYGEAVHQFEMAGGGANAARNWLIAQGRSLEQASQFVDSMQQLERMGFDTFIKRGARVGGREPIDLSGRFGVGRYVIHSSLDMADDDLMRQMIRSGADEGTAARVVREGKSHLDPGLDPLSVSSTRGPTKVGPLDFNRVSRGTLRDKVLRGEPIDPNPFNASLRAVAGAERRILLDPLVGSRGRHIEHLVAAVGAGGGDTFLTRDLISSVAGKRYYPEALRRASKFMAGLQVTSKLPFAVFANATQSQNTMTWSGMKPFLRGIGTMAKRAERERTSQLLAVHHNVIRSLGRSFDDQGLVMGGMERAGDAVLTYSGFNAVERMNRIVGAGTAQFVIRDSIAKASRGRLRGTLLRERRAMLADMGLNLDDIVARVKRDPRFLESAAFVKLEEIATIRGAQRTQFFPGRTTRPTYWDHPIGRLAFQFKTFALGQSRFIRDGVLAEAANGNHRPLATILAIMPVAGEVVGDIRAVLKQNPRTTHGPARFFESMTYAGGFGLATDFLASAQHRSLLEALAGPSITDTVQFAEAMLSGDVQSVIRQVQRQNLFQATLRLVEGVFLTADTIDQYLDQQETDELLEGQQVVDLGAMRTRNKRTP